MRSKAFWTRIFGIAAILAVMAFSACDNGNGDDDGDDPNNPNNPNNPDNPNNPTPPAWAEFIGKWYSSSFNSTVEITANKLIFTWTNNSNYQEVINLTVTPKTNTGGNAATYPAGFEFAGTVANKNSAGIPANGDSYDITYYMHTNKGSIVTTTNEVRDKQ